MSDRFFASGVALVVVLAIVPTGSIPVAGQANGAGR